MAIFSLIFKIFFLLCASNFPFTSANMNKKRHELFSKSLEIFRQTDSNVKIHIHKPQRVTRQGDFMDTITLNELSQKDKKLRKRRSAEPRNVQEKLNAATAVADGKHEIFVDLGYSSGSPLSGARLHLKRNYRLVSENFVVEERSYGGKINRRHTFLNDCHYTGTIHNHESFSKVALSACNGLQGIIFKGGKTYFIEPLWKNEGVDDKLDSESHTNKMNNESLESHPHVIVRRSALEHLSSRRKNKEDLGHCGYSDKIRGRTPWWLIDPRDKFAPSALKNKHEKESDEDFDDIQNELDEISNKKHNKKKLNHHRSTASRLPDSEDDFETTNRLKRNVDEQNHIRQKRSTSLERNVETMVVADKTLVGYHGRREVEKYILTIMNIVANLYHDASIGNAVNIIVTRIILLTEDQPNLEISHHADQSLDSFCKWQRSINVNGTSDASNSGLAHHDNAVLLTGFDICTFKDEPCGTLGLAPVAGMCESERSCNINEDTGLSSAFTIAHEIGHNFGMHHDGNGNACGPDSGTPSKIMAPQLTKNTSPFSWSGCSRNYITKFLDSGSGECLIDSPPVADFVFPEEMPGQMHDAEEQCRFQFGPQSRQCKIGNVCRELWCLAKNERCITNSVPAAEGTSCTSESISNGWCYRGQCVPFGYRAQAIDGGWGQWTSWAECSRTCGSGISSSSRICNNPAPEHGGKYCIGDRTRYRICNSEPCPATSRDYRHEQCSQFDTEPFRGKYYNWLPFIGGHQSKPCALNCLAQGYNFYTERAPAVVDGTRCFSNSLDICIRGECHHVGCDNILHSEAIEDKCRVCGGDGSTCQTESQFFNDPVTPGNYHEIVTIPRGSVNIFIEELVISNQNYIAVKSTFGTNYINCGWTIDWPRKFEIAGTTFNYKRPIGEPESLQALGPINEDLVIMVLLQEPNRGIKYEYNVPVERATSNAQSAFLWEHDQWTPCSASCAGGMQQRPVVCRRVNDDTTVQNSYCNNNTMPVIREQTCNLEPCPAQWKHGSWSECSRNCGGGYRTRSVVCIRKITQTEDEIVNNAFCQETQPAIGERCNVEVCPTVWSSGSWSTCSVSCGNGFKTREVSCMSSDRSTRLNNESLCNINLKPNTHVRCNLRTCPRSVWKVKRWSSCSVSCGRGTRHRRVICIYHKTNVLSNNCPSSNEPHKTMSCSTPCNNASVFNSKTDDEQCVDDPKVHYCPLVRRFKFCKRQYFRKLCCHTCSR